MHAMHVVASVVLDKRVSEVRRHVALMMRMHVLGRIEVDVDERVGVFRCAEVLMRWRRNRPALVHRFTLALSCHGVRR